MKTIEVGCAIIFHEGRILIAQRNADSSLGGYWEFPGGKREAGESLEECLIREVQEELGVVIQPEKFLRRTFHKYPDKTLALDFYLCKWVSGEPQALYCQAFQWVDPKELKNFQFPPADKEIIEELMKG